MVGDGGYDEISAVCCDHCGLRKTGPRVVLLDEGMDTHDSDSNTEYEVEGDEELIQCTPRACKVCVEQTREHQGKRQHQASRAKEDPLP